MDAGAIKFITEYRTHQDRQGVYRTIVQAGGVTFLTAVFSAVCLAGFASSISKSLYHKPELTTFLVYFAAGIPLYAVTGVFLASLQAHQTVRPLIIVRYIWEPVGKFVLAGLAVWAGWGLAGVLGASLMTLLISLVLTIGLLQSVAPFRVQGADLWRGDEARRLLTYCLPLGTATLFGVVAPRADILILGSWASIHDIGLYQAGPPQHLGEIEVGRRIDRRPDSLRPQIRHLSDPGRSAADDPVETLGHGQNDAEVGIGD